MKFCWPKAKAKKHKAKKLHSRGSLAQQTHGNGQRGKKRQEERERLGTVGEREGESGTPGLRRAKLKGQTSWHSQLALLPMDGRRTGQQGVATRETKAELSNARLPKSKIAAKHFQVAAAASSELCYKFMRRHKFCNVCFGYTTKHTHTHTQHVSVSHARRKTNPNI